MIMLSLSEVFPVYPYGDWFESYRIDPKNCSDDFDLSEVLDNGATFELGKQAVSVLPWLWFSEVSLKVLLILAI